MREGEREKGKKGRWGVKKGKGREGDTGKKKSGQVNLLS